MPTRFLVVRLDGLGDTVLTTPMLAALRTHHPDAHVTVVASPAGHACLVDHPGVNELVVFSASQTTLSEKLALGRRLRAKGFHVAITATEKAWGYLWLCMSGAKQRIGFWNGAEKPVKSLLFRPTLTHRIANDATLCEPERHMRLLEPLGVHAPAGPIWLGRPQGPGTGPVAIHLSAKWCADGWNAAWLHSLVDQLADAGPLLLTAGAIEGEWARAFCAGLDRRDGRVSTLLDASYAEWTQGLSGCRHLVSMDTGAVHVAAGLGLPVVDIFPRADSERCVPRWKPWKVPHRIVLRPPAADVADGGEGLVQEIVNASRSLHS